MNTSLIWLGPVVVLIIDLSLIRAIYERRQKRVSESVE